MRLRKALSAFADVVVCAPFSEQSAMSHSITLHAPLRLRRHEPGVFSVSGTPADSVYVALCAGAQIVPRAPDLVVSGINHGLNLASDVFYSGTIAAAREAALRGFRAVALSANLKTNWDAALLTSVSLVTGLLEEPVPAAGCQGPLLNVNFPEGRPPSGGQWPVRSTHLGIRRYEDLVDFRADPRGGEYLWLGGMGVSHHGGEGSDTAAHDEGVVGLTALSLEMWSSEGQPVAERLAARIVTD